MSRIKLKTRIIGFAFTLISILFFASCESNNFDSDRRQIMAKDLIRSKVPRNRSFDIIGFREDTLTNWPDSSFKRPILYSLDFTFKDSVGALHNKRGLVVFTPDGRSIISSRITDR